MKNLTAPDCDNKFSVITHVPMYYQNIQSICSKDKIRDVLKTVMYKIICFTETWLTCGPNGISSDKYIPSRFVTYRTDRNVNNCDVNNKTDHVGGGVAILVDSSFKSKRLAEYENKEIECVCVEVCIGSSKVKLG